MKILLVQNMIYVPTHGGASKANRLLLEGLTAKGHSCRVVVPAFGTQVSVKTHAQFLAGLDARGISLISASSEVVVFQYNGVEVRAVIDSSRLHDYVASEIRDFEPTWNLVSNDDPGQLMLEAALEASPSRVVYLVHTPQALPFGPKAFLQDQAKTDLVRQTAGVVTESNHVKGYIKQWSGLDSLAIPFPIYGSGPFPDLGCFAKGYVTLINPCAVKGISIFLELARRMPEVQFAGVPTWGTTKADRAALEGLPNVRLLPAVDRIEEIFRQTRVLLMPSLWTESFPLTAREAMLHGIPVIGSNSGGLPETKLGIDYTIPVRLIEQYEDRFDELGNPVPIVPEQEIDPWEETLRKLLSDRALYERLSAASRNAALKFVSGVGITPFEDYLENLKPASRIKGGDALTSAKEQGAKANDLASVLSKLSPERRALLALRLRKKSESTPKVKKTIPRRSESDSIPLSLAQRQLWFIDQLEPGNPAYNMAWGFLLTGPLDVPVLEQSLSEIVRRHEALRTTFASVNGSPVQVIDPPLTMSLPMLDLSKLPESEREPQVLGLATEEARRPFDLARGPLFRASLLRLGQEEHVLLLNVHHSVYDLWSLGVLFRELAAIYEAFSAGQPSPLAELPIQYADYAVWQREWLISEAFEKQLSYWKQQLLGAPAMLELPTDHPRPAVQSFRGARQYFVLSKSLMEALKALSQRKGATLFMTLVAAFQTLLSRYTRQNDIVVGSPIAGRNRAETENLIGYFANTLVLRTDLSGDPAFGELLRRVREVALGAYTHQDLPFEKLVEVLQPKRDLSYNPIFQVLFALHNVPTPTVELPGLTSSPLEVDSGTAKFDLGLDLRETPQGLSGSLEYNTDLFNADTIARMVGHFQTLLGGIIADPEQSISTLPLLTEAEQQQVLVEWNSARTNHAQDQCLHELFEAHVERAPDAVAVVCEGEQLTYRELNEKANQLAHYLKGLGAGPEVLVGICVERSLEMIVGLLGIIKAGAAYVPLDPAYPHERLAFMLDDSRVPVLLTQQRLVEKLPETVAHIICLDADWDRIARENAENPVSGARAENLAYVIYTSGSTGRPKGVQVCHRSVVRLLEATRPLFDFDERDVWTVVHSYAFDFSVWEIWGALLQGCRLVIVPLWVTQTPADFYNLLRTERVTVLNQTPSAIRQLVQEKEKAAGTTKELSLRLIICGGEAFPRELASPLLKWGVPVWNFYGPTEATVWAAINEIKSVESEGESIPIGRPIADTQIYLLDENLQPVPVGVPGELHIGGAGLARGYLNRAELTAERFIANPFSSEAGARLYKTGDLARYLPDGKIEYLARKDHQVKVRGYRIELGEIEAVLGQHAGVRESVVIAREDTTGEKRLVAYLVSDQKPTISDLRSYLKERLPDYMVPAAFVLLDQLPLSPNGKVDRRALPAPDTARPALTETYVGPRTAVEEVVAGVWAEVLGVKQVGVHDNFFELGGHSLMATQVMSRLQEAFQVELALRVMFESPTVASLAESIEKARTSGAGLRAPAIVPVSRESYRVKLSSQ